MYEGLARFVVKTGKRDEFLDFMTYPEPAFLRGSRVRRLVRAVTTGGGYRLGRGRRAVRPGRRSWSLGLA